MFSFANTTDPWDTSSYRVVRNNDSSVSAEETSNTTNSEMGNISSEISFSSTSNDSFVVSGSSNVPAALQSSMEETFANIHEFITTAERNLNDIGLGTASSDASTPIVVNGQRNRRSDLTLDSEPRVIVARFAARDEVIDLRTPEVPRRVEGFINLEDSYEPPVRVNNRRGIRRLVTLNNSDTELIDLTPSPPKRSRSACNDSTTSDSYNCPVCLESVRQREPCTTRCGHVFCKTCIEAALRTTRKCPLCNKKVTLRQLQRIYI